MVFSPKDREQPGDKVRGVRRLTAGVVLVVLLSGCTEATGPTTSRPPATTRTPATIATPKPGTHAIASVCSTLSGHLRLLRKVARGRSPITDTAQEDFALAARQLNRTFHHLESTAAESDLRDLVIDANEAGTYQGRNLTVMFNNIQRFAQDANQFASTYCQ